MPIFGTFFKTKRFTNIDKIQNIFLETRYPNPTDDFKNLGPMRGSVPIDLEISSILASVASHNAEIEFIEETLWANIALATNFDNSEDQRFVVMICSLGTQLAYTESKVLIAFIPSGDCSPPIRTLDGYKRSSTAVPSAKNSGFDST